MTLRGYSEHRQELTPQMRAVVLAAARGLTEQATADELGVSRRTVTAIRAAMLQRVGATTITHAYALARDRGLL